MYIEIYTVIVYMIKYVVNHTLHRIYGDSIGNKSFGFEDNHGDVVG